MRSELLRLTVLGQMASAEKIVNQEFHRAFPSLDVLMRGALDSNNVAKLHEAIKILDDLLSEI